MNDPIKRVPNNHPVKKYSRNTVRLIMIGLSIAFALSTTSLTSIDSRVSLKPTTVPPIVIFTPTPVAVSHPGSTDGIMLMGFIIVLIIVLPIIFKRSTWTR